MKRYRTLFLFLIASTILYSCKKDSNSTDKPSDPDVDLPVKEKDASHVILTRFGFVTVFSSDLKLKWQKDYGGFKQVLPVRDRLLIATSKELICAELETGNVLWKRPANLDDGMAYKHSGKVYLTSAYGYFYEIDMKTGYRTELPGQGPALARVYFGDSVLYYLTLTPLAEYHLTAIDTAKGEVKWTTTNGFNVVGYSSMHFSKDIFITRAGNGFYAINTHTGQPVWNIQDYYYENEILSGNVMFAPRSTMGGIDAIDIATGKMVWQSYDFSPSISLIENLFIHNNELGFSVSDSNFQISSLVKVNAKTGKPTFRKDFPYGVLPVTRSAEQNGNLYRCESKDLTWTNIWLMRYDTKDFSVKDSVSVDQDPSGVYIGIADE